MVDEDDLLNILMEAIFEIVETYLYHLQLFQFLTNEVWCETYTTIPEYDIEYEEEYIVTIVSWNSVEISMKYDQISLL